MNTQVKHPIFGVFLMLGAMAVLPGIDVIAKMLGQQGLPILQVVWARLALGPASHMARATSGMSAACRIAARNRLEPLVW